MNGEDGGIWHWTIWEGQTEVKQGVLDGPVLCFIFFPPFFSVEFPLQRDAVRLMFGKYFPRLSSLFTWLATFPVFHLKECSYRIQKSKQSIYISFLLSIQFCIEKYVFVNFLFFLFFLFKFQMSLCGSRAYSICSYMCWASIMSKYLASMIWGSTLFLNTEQK